MGGRPRLSPSPSPSQRLRSMDVPALVDQYFELEVELAVAGISVPPAVAEMLQRSWREVEEADPADQAKYSAAIRTFQFRLATSKRLLPQPRSERQIKRPRTAAESAGSMSSDVPEVIFLEFQAQNHSKFESEHLFVTARNVQLDIRTGTRVIPFFLNITHIIASPDFLPTYWRTILICIMQEQ